MSDETHGKLVRACAGMSWVVQSRGVQVIDELARRSHTLAFPEATVWELLLRGHDTFRAGAMLRWIAHISDEEARGFVDRCVRDWTEAGWVETVDTE